MSFSDLKSKKQSKAQKSYVTTSTSSTIDITQPAAAQTEPHGPDGSKEYNAAGLYASLSPFLAVRQSEDTGRGLWMKEARSAGSILLLTKLHVHVLSTPFLDSHCSACAGPAPSAGLKRCTICRTTWYCDADCQKRDWGAHKSECAALRKWSEAAPSADVAVPADAIRCLGRLCWKQRAQGSSSIWAREVDAMQSHRKDIPSASFEKYTHMAHALVRYLGLSSLAELANFGFASAESLMDLLSRFTTNSFTLTSPSLTPIGVCVSPLVALINHSCEPNAVVVFPRSGASLDEPQMQVVALKALQPGEELLTAYVDTTLPRHLRRQNLREAQSFTCACGLCNSSSTPDEDPDPREAMWCPKQCGGMCRLPTEENALVQCSKCRTPMKDTDAVLDALRVGHEALDKATALQHSDPSYALRLTKNMAPILNSAGLTPSTHPLLALTRLQQYLALADLSTQEALDDAVRIAARCSSGLSAILAYGHPVRAIQLAEMGKVLAADEPSPPSHPPDASAGTFPPHGALRLKLALDTLVRARNELLVGFGKANEGGAVGREVREAIVRVERELGVWKQGIRNVWEDVKEGKKKT